MTNYQVEDIVKDVRVAIDQNSQQTDLARWGDVDTLTLSDIIRSKIEDAAKFIESNAPTNLLEGLTSDEKVTHTKLNDSDTNYVVTAKCPTDYMRLLLFSVDDWAHPVSEAIDASSPLYAFQRMKVEAVRGNPEAPVVAIVQHHEDGLVLEGYSTAKNSSTVKVIYVPQPGISGGKISLPSKLYRAIVYATAYLTSVAYGDQSKAAMLLSVAKGLAHISEMPATAAYVPQTQQEEEEQ